MKYTVISAMPRKRSRATTKLTLLTASKDEWNTMEDTVKSLKNALDVPWYAERHLSKLKRRQTVKKSSLQPLLLSTLVSLKTSFS